MLGTGDLRSGRPELSDRHRLGLFALGQLTSVKPSSRWIPWAAVSSPLLTYAASWAAPKFLGYTFGFELILLNGLITALLLALGPKNK